MSSTVASLLGTMSIAAIDIQQVQQQPNQNVPFFSSIPDEILTEIFSYLRLQDLLEIVRGVDRRFRSLCSHNVTEIDTSSQRLRSLLFLPGKFTQLLPTFRRLKWLRLCPWNKNWEMFAVEALRLCPLLEGLSVAYVDSPVLFDAVKQHGKSLRRISLTGACWLDPTSFRNLTHIELQNCDGLDSEVLMSIGNECERLECMQCLGYWNRIGDDAMGTFLNSVKDRLNAFHWEIISSRDQQWCWDGHLSQCQKLEKVRVTCLSQRELRSLLEATVRMSSLTSLGLSTTIGTRYNVETMTMGDQVTTLALEGNILKDRNLIMFTKRVKFPGLLQLILDDQVSAFGMRCLAVWCGKTLRGISLLDNRSRSSVFVLLELVKESWMPELKSVKIGACCANPETDFVNAMGEFGVKLLC